MAIRENPADANAHFQLGNLYANLGRVGEAIDCWNDAVRIDPTLSVAQRNLGVATMTVTNDATKAAEYYARAIAARPDDQTLHRDLAEILIANGKRREAIQRLESMPLQGPRRSEITIMLAQAYLDEGRFGDTIELLESTPYFVNWEGQDITWSLFHRAHLERGIQELDAGRLKSALTDFEAAVTYPANLGVGRTNEPQHARAEFLRGSTLMKLGRATEARAAWEAGATCVPRSDEQMEYKKRCEENLKALGVY
jgi:tetratricopeptide (TPR) repeat protein